MRPFTRGQLAGLRLIRQAEADAARAEREREAAENLHASDKLSGFAKLREGRIHLRCYVCGRKMSNVERNEFDPPTAVLMELPCDKHDTGMEPPIHYFNAAGSEVCDAR